MDRAAETALIERCLAQIDTGTTTLSTELAPSPVDRYLCQERFQQEMSLIHRRLPVPYVHTSELSRPNTFRRVQTSVGDVLITRDDSGAVHAFHNVCRHRGAGLVDAESGSARRLVCPYHAWSYATDGALTAVPGEDPCFPNLEKDRLGLRAIPCTERFGFVWLCPDARDSVHAAERVEQHLGAMAADIAWLEMDSLQAFDRCSRRWEANWKLVSEGGLETYHFRTAHQDTIGPYFLNNLSVQDDLGGNFRVVMPLEKMRQAAALPAAERRLRDLTHTLFTIGPQTSFLAQAEHVDWIRMTPLAVDATEVVITSLVPGSADGMSAEQRRHWDTNLKITLATLDEDFEIGESIQRGLASGTNQALTFGRNEGLLAAFNSWVERLLQAG